MKDLRAVAFCKGCIFLAAISICQVMVGKMVASKLLGVVGIFLVVNYAAGNGQCAAPIRGRPQCPPTWSQWHDKCYKMHDAKVTWEEGKQTCSELGGEIVVPKSTEELQHLLNMFSCKFWIGCNDIEVEGTWVCLDGEGTIDVQDKRWDSGQPDNYKGEQDCAIGRVSFSGWDDVGCGNAWKLICQRPASPVLLLL